jgi:tetratricopeptide (TPR) repeat protein
VAFWDVSFTDLHRTLEAAIGYFELGMPGDALAELDTLSPLHQETVEALELRAVIEQDLGKWNEAAATYEKLCKYRDIPVERYISWACCLYEACRVEECVDALNQAPKAATADDALWNFHMACYEAIVGNKHGAREHVARSIQLDARFKPMAERNRNLRPLLE